MCIRDRILLCVYLGIWAVSVLFFWLLTGPSDAMGYGIVFLWLVLPVAAFVISLDVYKRQAPK